jgi:hypothetical protein
LSERHVVIGGLFFFAFWLLVALPFLYTVPRYSHDEATNNCSAEESKNHGFWEKAGCDPTAYFTLWLVAFTGVLAISTIGLGWATLGLYKTGERQIRLNAETAATQSRDMQDSIAASMIAANAASQSAEVAEQTLLASGRPLILLEMLNTDNIGFALGTHPSMDIRFVNHGSAPAILKVCFIELLDNPPAPPELDVSKLDRTYQIVGAGKVVGPMTVPVKTDNSAQVWMGDQAKRLVLHGYLEYADTLDAVHTHRIYLRLGKSAQTLTEEGSPEYNVRKTVRIESEEAQDGPSRSDTHGD